MRTLYVYVHSTTPIILRPRQQSPITILYLDILSAPFDEFFDFYILFITFLSYSMKFSLCFYSITASAIASMSLHSLLL